MKFGIILSSLIFTQVFASSEELFSVSSKAPKQLAYMVDELQTERTNEAISIIENIDDISKKCNHETMYQNIVIEINKIVFNKTKINDEEIQFFNNKEKLIITEKLKKHSSKYVFSKWLQESILLSFEDVLKDPSYLVIKNKIQKREKLESKQQIDLYRNYRIIYPWLDKSIRLSDIDYAKSIRPLIILSLNKIFLNFDLMARYYPNNSKSIFTKSVIKQAKDDKSNDISLIEKLEVSPSPSEKWSPTNDMENFNRPMSQDPNYIEPKDLPKGTQEW